MKAWPSSLRRYPSRTCSDGSLVPTARDAPWRTDVTLVEGTIQPRKLSVSQAKWQQLDPSEDDKGVHLTIGSVLGERVCFPGGSQDAQVGLIPEAEHKQHKYGGCPPPQCLFLHL